MAFLMHTAEPQLRGCFVAGVGTSSILKRKLRVITKKFFRMGELEIIHVPVVLWLRKPSQLTANVKTIFWDMKYRKERCLLDSWVDVPVCSS
jgi:hypothetical protein